MAKSVKSAAPAVPPAPAGWLQLADGRRNHAVRDLMGKRADLQRELDAPATGIGGIPSDYLRQRRVTLLAEAEQVEAEIAELSGLSGDALVWRFCKADVEASQQARDMADAGVTAADLLNRGAPAPYRAVQLDIDRDIAVLTRARQQGWYPNLGV
jgi:hypothetical protein